MANYQNNMRLVLENLGSAKILAALLQSAYGLLEEGISRPQVSQVTARAADTFGTNILPSIAGQLLRRAGIKTCLIHGKARLVLEQKQLSDLIQQTSSQTTELSNDIESSLQRYGDLAQRVNTLEKRYQELLQLRQREKALTALLILNQDVFNRVSVLEQQNQEMIVVAERVKDLEEENELLSELIQSLPALTERKQKLEGVLNQYRDSEKSIIANEVRLSVMLNALQKRSERVELVSVQEEIINTRLELEDVRKQLGEKRSLLDKVRIHRKNG
jgi:DNA repair exonuclease SbcCD ATPase subunit